MSATRTITACGYPSTGGNLIASPDDRQLQLGGWKPSKRSRHRGQLTIFAVNNPYLACRSNTVATHGDVGL